MTDVRPDRTNLVDPLVMAVPVRQEPIDGFSRYCLMNGLDQLGFLLESEAEIQAFEEARA